MVASRLLELLYLEYDCPEGELCAIETDPWTDAQDGKVTEPLTYKVLSNSANKATVQMGDTFDIGEGRLLDQRALMKFERSSERS